MNRSIKCAAAVLLSLAGVAPALAMTETAYALTSDSSLVSIEFPHPSFDFSPVTAHGTITGLQPAEKIVDIDFRPATGELYGLGSTTRLYKIDPQTAAATQVGTSTFDAGSSTEFGMDVDPVNDQVRVVTNEDHNIVLDPDGVAEPVVGTALSPASELSDIAYSNSFPGATTTTLYGLDTDNNNLVTISPEGAVTAITPIGGVNDNMIPGSSLDIHNGLLYGLIVTGSGNPQIKVINPSNGSLGPGGLFAEEVDVISIAIRPHTMIQQGKKGPLPPKASIKLNFAKPGADSIAASGALRVPEL